ncbi:MAG: DoxX family membrane protein [Propionibacteriaceae bacterium]|jgi:uncharacterized membrane protein YphA (DoxX/SURF4 family)|nr:DoxX family membrane protein [Propionibacteriaceae bacterium]
MSILHFIPRAMLAGYFAWNGLKAFRSPQDFADQGAAIEKLLPRDSLPSTLADKIPPDTTALVKCAGLTQLAGAAMLATGIGRRLGAGLVAATLVPQVAARRDNLDELLANVSLLGGALLAAADTQGKPSLLWKLRLQREILAQDSKRQRRIAKREAKQAIEA